MLESCLDFSITFCEAYGLWIMAVLIFLGFVIVIGAKACKIKLSSTVFLWITLIFAVFPIACAFFVFDLNPRHGGYGYAVDNFEVVAQEDNILWGIDYRTTPGGGATGGGGVAIYRVQGLNLDSGTKLFRKLIPYEFKALGDKNHLVWVSTGKEVLGMDLMSGETRITINEQNLMEKFPELAKGVYEYKYNTNTSLVDVVSKDGTSISIDPVANIKIDHAATSLTKSEHDAGNLDTLRRKITFKGDIRQKLTDANGHILNEDLTFLKGEFLLFDKASERALVMSYETLDKKKFVLRYLSLDGKLLWEAKQHDLKVGDFFNSEPRFEKAFLYKDKVIMAFYGFVFSLNVSNGHLNWLTRM